jgi:hypothetical protein
MRKRHRFQSLDYVPPVVAFLAAVAAVVGSPKWNSDASSFAKITPFGWIVLAIGLLALITSVLVTSRNKREQARQKQTKERIAAIGAERLLKAFHHAVHPIIGVSIWRDQCESPESPLQMLDPTRRKLLASLDLNSASPYADGSFEEIRWFSMLERAAKGGSEEITKTLQRSSFIPISSTSACATSAKSCLPTRIAMPTVPFHSSGSPTMKCTTKTTKSSGSLWQKP